MRKIPFNPETVMRAHQYLYYVLAQPVWDDYGYDMFCKAHGLEGGGGSDMASSYSNEEKILALEFYENPINYPPTMRFVSASAQSGSLSSLPSELEIRRLE